MIILDTNVVSELMKKEPDGRVLKWIQSKDAATLALTAITVAEIHRGIDRLPVGRRKRDLKYSFDEFLKSAFSGRIFSFDTDAALAYAQVASGSEKNGFNTDAVDLMIAGIAHHQAATLATRNEKDFRGCSIKTINPWG